MRKNKPYRSKKVWKSFEYAFSGIIVLLKEEPNARFHLLATIVSLFFGFFFKLSSQEWLALLFAIALVWVAEIFNTALENLSDRISLEKDPFIKKAKDLAAAAVLISALVALIIGLLLFLPPLIQLLKAFL
jgi:diacylglycerol kinase